MNTDKLGLRRILEERRDNIADCWYQAIAETSLGKLADRGAPKLVDKLTDRLIDLLLAESFDPQRADSLGSDLASLRSLRPETLGRSQEVLVEQILKDLPSDHRRAVYSRLTSILTHLATGFVRRTRDKVLKEQEQIHRAFVIAINNVKKDLMIKDAAITSSINAICFCDSDGRITEVNPAFLDMWGYDSAEIIGEDVTSLAKDSDYLSGVSQTLRDEDGWVGEFVAQREDGSSFYVLVSASMVRIEQDHSSWLMYSFIDITERKRNQETLEQHAVQLAFLDEIGQQIANLLDLDKVLKKVVDFVQEAFDYHQTSIFVVDWEQDIAILRARAGNLTDPPSDHSIPLGEGIVGWVGHHGIAEVANGEHARRRYGNTNSQVTSVCSEMAIPIQVHGETWGVLNIQSPRRDSFGNDDILVMKTVVDRLAVAVENAQLYDAVKREQRALEQHVERLEILHNVDQAILGAKSVEEVAHIVLGRAWGMVPHCWWSGLVMFDFDADELYLIASRSSVDVEVETRSSYPIGPWEDFLHKLKQGQPVVMEDIRQVMDRAEDIQALYAKGLRAVITVPMRYQGELIGMLILGTDKVGGLGEKYVPVAQEIADSVATVIQQAHLLESLNLQRDQLRTLMRRLSEAEEAERRNLARILHNQIGQTLTALGLNLNVLKSQLGADSSVALHERIDDSLRLVEDMADRIRRVTANLRPPMLEDYGLVAALDWYSKQFTSRVDVAINVASEQDDFRLPTKVELALFRIAQEALTNALKHAQASEVTIMVDVDDHFVRLRIVDDGVGFDVNERPEPDDEQSWGLLNMRERAQAVGGRCRIKSRPGKGTEIMVEVSR